MNANIILEILEAVGLLIGASTIIARLTPTQTDDKFVERVRKVFENISHLFLPDKKQK